MRETDLTNAIITILLVFLILFIGTFTINATIEAAPATSSGNGTSTNVSEAALLSGTDYVRLDSETGVNETVVNSRGYAVVLAGTDDSSFQTEQNIQIADDDTWSVSTGASVDAAATGNMTAVSANGRVLIQYTGANWTAYYYDDSSTDSYRVNVSAPNQPGNLSYVTATSNSTHFTIYRNTTQGEVVSLNGSNIANATINSSNWHGRIDETRTFDDYTNASEQSSLVSDPVDPRPARNRTARIMFDQPGQSVQLLFFAPGGVQTSNVTYASGYPGAQMQEGDFAIAGSDYKWDSDGPRIKAISGGELDGAPVAYVNYTLKTSESNTLSTALRDDWTAAMSLAGVFLILVPLGVVIWRLSSTRR